MSEVLATSPRLDGEAETVEGRLADILEHDRDVWVGGQPDGYRLSESDLNRVIFALRRFVHS